MTFTDKLKEALKKDFHALYVNVMNVFLLTFWTVMGLRQIPKATNWAFMDASLSNGWHLVVPYVIIVALQLRAMYLERRLKGIKERKGNDQTEAV